MDILEHPIEAVAFRLYSLPDASAATGAAAWTCLAAVLAAAAAGLWRLRSATPAAATATLKPLELEPSNAKVVSPETPSSSVRSPGSAASTPAAVPSPKERYTVYYRDCNRVGFCDLEDEEGYNDEEEEAEAEAQDEDGDDGGGVYWTPETTTMDPFGWEVVRTSLPLSPTAAEMGRYWSPTPALSGSVVRLWDEALDVDVTTAGASPRRSSSRVVGTVSAF